MHTTLTPCIIYTILSSCILLLHHASSLLHHINLSLIIILIIIISSSPAYLLPRYAIVDSTAVCHSFTHLHRKHNNKKCEEGSFHPTYTCVWISIVSSTVPYIRREVSYIAIRPSSYPRLEGVLDDHEACCSLPTIAAVASSSTFCCECGRVGMLVCR